MNRISLTILVLFFSCFAAVQAQAQSDAWLAPFVAIHQQDPGNVKACESNTEQRFVVCSEAFRNEGNGPFILHHGQPTDETFVLFHGLSDSPFYMRSIASAMHQRGMTVVVGILPGHGLKEADDDMEDSDLDLRWQKRVADTMAFANGLSGKVYIGGFSTGGALASLYALQNPQQVDALLLFSGALALEESVEDMAGIWGIKWLAKIIDGSYVSEGPNPYKYPQVSNNAALELMDVIEQVRELNQQGVRFDLPIFSAHSLADTTTPFRGIQALKAANDGRTEIFAIDKQLNVCHADLVVSASQLNDMAFDVSKVEEPEACSIPKANPQHDQMIQAMLAFLASN